MLPWRIATRWETYVALPLPLPLHFYFSPTRLGNLVSVCPQFSSDRGGPLCCGQMHELWEAVLVLIQRRDAEVTRIVCDVVGDLTFRHEKNALAFLKHHGMLDAVVDLIDNGEEYDTQVHGWRLLECCVEDVEVSTRSPR